MQDVELLDSVKSTPAMRTGNLSPVVSAAANQKVLPVPRISVPPALPPQFAAARGVGSVFMLDPRIAVLVIVTDLTLFAGDVVTIGGFVPIAMFFAAALGFITYQAQMAWHNDDRKNAFIKGMIVGFLTALPGPISAFFAVPGVIIGVLKKLGKR
jgi:hypothetical protein